MRIRRYSDHMLAALLLCYRSATKYMEIVGNNFCHTFSGGSQPNVSLIIFSYHFNTAIYRKIINGIKPVVFIRLIPFFRLPVNTQAGGPPEAVPPVHAYSFKRPTAPGRPYAAVFSGSSCSGASSVGYHPPSTRTYSLSAISAAVSSPVHSGQMGWPSLMMTFRLPSTMPSMRM